MTTHPDILVELNRLIEAARDQRILLRAIGGLAIRVHCDADQRLFKRDYPDMDFIVPSDDRRKLEPFFGSMGYESNRQFNLLNGARRQIYQDDSTGRRVDIFVGDFEMCHKLPMHGRMRLDPVTVPLAELLLSKAQIVQLNHKDALDITSILFYNDTGNDDDGKINIQYIAQLCSQDWGLYKTTSINLKRVEQMLLAQELQLGNDERDLVLGRLRQILHACEERPKPLPWQLRDRIGTRVRWYIEVEEVAR